MIFRRRKDNPEEEAVATNPEPGEAEDVATEDAEETGGDTAPEVADYDRSEGPLDLSEVDEQDAAGAGRIDLGCLQIPMIEGLEIRVEVDQQTNTPMAVTLVRGEGAIQVRAFAAPRSGGVWAEAYRDVRGQITHDGGTVDERTGRFGSELVATVPAQDERGRQVMQKVRFVGVEGPRWMLQGILFGAGVDPTTAGALEDVYRRLVVVRGDTAMPMGAPLPVVLPQQVPDDVEDLEEVEDSQDTARNGDGPRA